MQYIKSNNISTHTCKAYSITNEQFTGLLLDIIQISELICYYICNFPFNIITTEITNKFIHVEFLTQRSIFT